MYTVFHGGESRDNNNFSSFETVAGTECDRMLRHLYPYELGEGIFLDVGAGQPIFINNAYHFRQNGWQIISIDANPIHCKLFRDENFEIIECAVADYEASDQKFDIHHCYGHMLSGSSLRPNNLENTNIETISVEVKTIDTLLKKYYPDLTKINILSIDVEGGEITALMGFDIKKYRPDVCCIEDWQTYFGTNHADKGINPELLEYMKASGYECVLQHCYDTYWKRFVN